MNEIRTLLSLAARRLETSRFLAILHVAALVAAILAAVLVGLERLPAAGFVPWVVVAPLLAAATVGAAALVWSRRRRGELNVAMAVDDRLGLHDALSTAIHCADRDDAFARAAVEHAVHVARDPRRREQVTRRFAIEAPRGWWLSPALVLAAFALSFAGHANVFERAPEAEVSEAALEAKRQADQQIETMVDDIRDAHPDLDERLEEMLGTLADASAADEPLESPEQAKRNRIKELTSLQKRLDQILDGEEGKTAETVEEALESLRRPEGDTVAAELAEELARGDFAAAQDTLQKMLEQVARGELDEQQKEQLARQLQDVAQQLQQLAQQQRKLEQALEEAGLDPQLAQNPQALQQAIQNAQNLNQQQKQQLQQMAKAQQQACRMCEGLGQAMQQMAQGMQGQQGQQGQPGQGAQQAMQQGAGQMGEMLGDLEALQQMLQQAQAMQDQAGQMCQGLGQGLGMQQAMQQWQQQQQQQGGAMGQRGQGAGGNAPNAPTPFRTTPTKANIKLTQGDIIARQLIESKEQHRGESTRTVAQLAVEIAEQVEQGLEEDQLPRKYWDAQRHYFGEVEKRARELQDDERNAPAADRDDDDGDA